MKKGVFFLLLFLGVLGVNAQTYFYSGMSYSYAKFENFWNVNGVNDKLFSVPAYGLGVGILNDRSEQTFSRINIGISTEYHYFKKLYTVRRSTFTYFSYSPGIKIKKDANVLRLSPMINLCFNEILEYNFRYKDLSKNLMGYFISPGVGVELDHFIGDNKFISISISDVLQYEILSIIDGYKPYLWGNILSVQVGLNFKL